MLKGSEKQIAWAKRIKTERLAIWKQSDPLVFIGLESDLKNQLSASWWITCRDKCLKDVLPLIAEGGAREKKVVVKLDTPKLSPVYSSLDSVCRFVGETRSIATGEIVVDVECPF